MMQFQRVIIGFYLILCGCFLSCKSALAVEPGGEILSQVISTAGDRVIRNGEFHYQLRVTVESPSREELDLSVNQAQEGLRSLLELRKDDPDITAKLQAAIDSTPQVAESQIISNSDVMWRFYFALEGPELGGDRYIEISKFNRSASMYVDPRSILLRSFGNGKGSSLELDSKNGMVIAGRGRQDVVQPSQEPQGLGRVNGSLPYIVAAMSSAGMQEWVTRAVSDFQLNTVADELGIETLKLEFKVSVAYPEYVKARLPKDVPASSTLLIVYHIVPSRGFITPLVRETDAAGNVLYECISSEYFLVPGTDLWFPLKSESRTFIPGKKEPRVERYTFEKDGVQLNHKIPDERFAVTIPPKTQIIDATGSVHTNYQTTREIALSIDDVAQLGQLDGVSPLSDPVPLTPKKLIARPGATLLFWANMAALLALVVWMIRRRLKRPEPSNEPPQR